MSKGNVYGEKAGAGHAVVGCGWSILEAVRRSEDVNLAVVQDAISPQVLSYLEAIDLKSWFEDHWTTASEQAPKGHHVRIFPAIFGRLDPFSIDAAALIRKGMEGFPESPELSHLVDSIHTGLRQFASVTGAREVSSFIMGKDPVPKAAWHRDNATDIRGLITLVGPGTYWRPNNSVPERDWLQKRKDKDGAEVNSFGMLGHSFMEEAQQIEAGSIAVWKGDFHSRPLIHAEPIAKLSGAHATRLVLHMDMVR